MDLSPLHLAGLAVACLCLTLGIYLVAAGRPPRLLTRKRGQPFLRSRHVGAALILVGIATALNPLISPLTNGSSSMVTLLTAGCWLGATVLLAMARSARRPVDQPPR